MLAEWSAECSAEDPVLVVPWKDPDGKAAFVDLSANPYDFDAIPEAEQHPPLMHALRALNASRSPVFTAKCDVWSLDGEEVEHLRMSLDMPQADASANGLCGFASYIDLVWRDRSVFGSFHQQEQMLRHLTRLAASLDYTGASLDCVLRPAFVDLDGPREGYAFSLYIKGIGDSPEAAWKEWAAAIDAVVAIIRSKDFPR
jgi:hypothetical protein